MPKIHVMRSKLTVDVVVDPTNADSIMYAADVLNSIHRHATGQDHVTLEITDSRLVRVDAPEPVEPEASEPADDDKRPGFLDRKSAEVLDAGP